MTALFTLRAVLAIGCICGGIVYGVMVRKGVWK